MLSLNHLTLLVSFLSILSSIAQAISPYDSYRNVISNPGTRILYVQRISLDYEYIPGTDYEYRLHYGSINLSLDSVHWLSSRFYPDKVKNYMLLFVCYETFTSELKV